MSDTTPDLESRVKAIEDSMLTALTACRLAVKVGEEMRRELDSLHEVVKILVETSPDAQSAILGIIHKEATESGSPEEAEAFEALFKKVFPDAEVTPHGS